MFCNQPGKKVVVIPTFNEVGSIEAIIKRITEVCPDVDIVVVDDSSPDSTGVVVDRLATHNPAIKCIHRRRKSGLAQAYIEGIKFALERGYEYIANMDADFSHDPEYLPLMFELGGEYDLVLGSRYVEGGGAQGWDAVRKILSRGASFYSRNVLKCPVRDMTSGFRCFKRSFFDVVRVDSIISNGYSFSIELVLKAFRRGLKIKEFPIIFKKRATGKTKISFAIIIEAFFNVLRLRNNYTINPKIVKKVLIFSPNWVGDSIMSFPIVKALCNQHPGNEVTIVSRPNLVPLWQEHSYLREIIPFDVSDKNTGLTDYLRVFKRLKKGSFDLAIILPGCLRWSLLSLLAGIRYRIGFSSNAGSFLFSSKVPEDKNKITHMSTSYMRIIEAIGINDRVSKPVFKISDKYNNFASDFLINNSICKENRIVGLAPTAIYGPAKRWPEEYFADLADKLIDSYGAKILIFGAHVESGIGRRIAGLMKNNHANLVFRKDIMEAASLLNRCDLFVTNDSGLMHLASALGVKVVAIFGSTSPIWTGPDPEGSKVVRKNLPCSPCFKKTCYKGSYECLRSITVEEVFSAAELILRESV